jgi:alkanesulfonate monooxygenase
MVAQYADACNIGSWVGDANIQKALDTLRAHCETLGRDYDAIEKTALCTAHLSGDDTVDSLINRLKELAEMGFTHVIFNMPDVFKITPLETFAADIIPAVAEL